MNIIYSRIFKFIPKEVKDLITGDGRWIWLLFVVGGMVGLLIGCELICLYFLGKVLLGQSIPIQANGLFISGYLDNLTQSQLLLYFAVIFAGVIGMRYSFFILYHYLSLKWNALVSTRIQNKMMESILMAPISFHDKSKQSGIVHGLMEASFGVCFTIDAISSLITSFFNILLILLTIVFISPWLILGSMVIGIPIFFVLMAPMQRKVRHLKNQFIKERTLAMEMAINVINGISDIKSLSSEPKNCQGLL